MVAMNLVPGGMGGTETYATNLARLLAQRDDVDLRTIVPGNARGVLHSDDERSVGFVRAGHSTALRLASLAASTLGAPFIRRRMSGADVVHYPFTSFTPAPPAGMPFVTTLHDVQHLDLPELFGPRDFAYRERFYHEGARRARLVITISEFAKRAIVDHLGIADDRVRVIPLGVDHERFTPATGPRGDFVLYPARGWPHKNHARLIEAMSRLRERRPGLRLVLTGGALDGLGALPEWVERRGLVNVDELTDLYRTASALVYPSLYEGFGLPPLEAMASGCPVAASREGSIPEVCGDAAVLFDPHDPEAIARGIEEAIDGADRLVTLGIEHARRFTWERCASQHIAAYRDAVGD
ncbi:glycosyltransferase family 1 protein [Agromyces sp. H66]|uniref:glycosyltransferase family 4 protein n=1 Tax=Agromyces sp. H66 TaxID=2529859 RepID=UPI00145AB86F|nr:glycosyltransferase family 1 protein [Agromyces sp. H66]